MEEIIQEKISADHLLYVSLKYTKTCDVIINLLLRWKKMIETSIDEILKRAKKKKKISTKKKKKGKKRAPKRIAKKKKKAPSRRLPAKKPILAKKPAPAAPAAPAKKAIEPTKIVPSVPPPVSPISKIPVLPPPKQIPQAIIQKPSAIIQTAPPTKKPRFSSEQLGTSSVMVGTTTIAPKNFESTIDALITQLKSQQPPVSTTNDFTVVTCNLLNQDPYNRHRNKQIQNPLTAPAKELLFLSAFVDPQIFQHADLLLFQEVFYNQQESQNDRPDELKNIPAYYHTVSCKIGPNACVHNGTATAYNINKFDLTKQEYFWLPDPDNASSVSFGVLFTKLQLKTGTKKSIGVFNTYIPTPQWKLGTIFSPTGPFNFVTQKMNENIDITAWIFAGDFNYSNRTRVKNLVKQKIKRLGKDGISEKTVGMIVTAKSTSKGDLQSAPDYLFYDTRGLQLNSLTMFPQNFQNLISHQTGSNTYSYFSDHKAIIAKFTIT